MFFAAPALTWAAAWFARFFTDSVLKYVAYKALAITLITVTFPIVLKNMFVWMLDQIMLIANNSLDTEGLDSVIISFTGLAAYLADQFLLADCLSVIMTCCIIRLTLNFIPFVK